MSFNSNSSRSLGLFLFAIGLILGLIYQAGSVWADFEASIFDSVLPANWADSVLESYSCPLVINSQETATITASFTNTTERDANLRIRLHISDGLVTLFREENTILPIAPGSTQQGEWIVYPKNAAWGHFILVRIFQFRAYKIPSRSASCGVLVFDLFNLSGNQIVILLILASLLGMLGGIVLFVYANQPLRSRNLSIGVAMILLVILGITGILVSFFGGWVSGAGILLITVLLLIALLPFAFRVNQI
jgi:hypothetical protein